MRIKSTNYENTCKLGAKLAKNFRGGEVVELSGDLGAGKTALATGFAKGIDSADSVGSPTFTLSKIYHGPKLTIHHFDFYRLPEPGLMSEQLQEVFEDPKAVTVIEWAGIVKDVLPSKYIQIAILRDEDDDCTRWFELRVPKSMMYIYKGIA